MLNEIIVDVFAGGGGASSSIACAVGRSVDVAIDHDPAAIVMHRANHPHTKHLLQPIGGYTMYLEGKIVFISGAITGVDGYRKFFPLQNNGYSNRGVLCSILQCCRRAVWSGRRTFALQKRWYAKRMLFMSSKTGNTAAVFRRSWLSQRVLVKRLSTSPEMR